MKNPNICPDKCDLLHQREVLQNGREINQIVGDANFHTSRQKLVEEHSNCSTAKETAKPTILEVGDGEQVPFLGKEQMVLRATNSWTTTKKGRSKTNIILSC